jgi:hypothetical protein
MLTSKKALLVGALVMPFMVSAAGADEPWHNPDQSYRYLGEHCNQSTAECGLFGEGRAPGCVCYQLIKQLAACADKVYHLYLERELRTKYHYPPEMVARMMASHSFSDFTSDDARNLSDAYQVAGATQFEDTDEFKSCASAIAVPPPVHFDSYCTPHDTCVYERKLGFPWRDSSAAGWFRRIYLCKQWTNSEQGQVGDYQTPDDCQGSGDAIAACSALSDQGVSPNATKAEDSKFEACMNAKFPLHNSPYRAN